MTKIIALLIWTCGMAKLAECQRWGCPSLPGSRSSPGRRRGSRLVPNAYKIHIWFLIQELENRIEFTYIKGRSKDDYLLSNVLFCFCDQLQPHPWYTCLSLDTACSMPQMLDVIAPYAYPYVGCPNDLSVAIQNAHDDNPKCSAKNCLTCLSFGRPMMSRALPSSQMLVPNTFTSTGKSRNTCKIASHK